MNWSDGMTHCQTNLHSKPLANTQHNHKRIAQMNWCDDMTQCYNGLHGERLAMTNTIGYVSRK